MEGIHIYNRLLMHKGNVEVTVEGIAASMASIIAMAGNKVSMLEASWLMIHNPSGLSMGEAVDHRKAAETLDKIRETMADAYARRTGASVEQVVEWMDAETWFSPAEALEHGFIDEVLEIPADMAACLRAVGDLSQFENIPDELTASIQAAMPSMRWDDIPAHIQEAITAALRSGQSTTATQPATDQPQPSGTAASQKGAPSMDPKEKAAIEAAAREQARQAEMNRRTEVRAVLQPMRAALGEDFEALERECVDDMEVTADAARAKVLEVVARRNEEVHTPGSGPVTVVADQRDKFRAGVKAAIMARAGLAKDDTANEFRGMRLLDVARECVLMADPNANLRGMRPFEIAGAAFSHSSSDFPLLLEDSARKILQDAYQGTPVTWRRWARAGSVSDFKAARRLRLGSFSNLEVVRPGGEYKEGAFEEERETIQAQTKGKILSFDRQMIVNDDLDGFSRATQMLGRAAARTVEKDAVGVINDNAAMSDGVALFHADHNNLAGSGAALSVTTLSAGKAAMRKQKFSTTDDEILDIMAEVLLVPVAIEDNAKTLIASETDPGQSNSRKPNIHRNTLEVVSSPYLDLTSATAWYLLAGAGDVPVVEVAFLDGVQEPFLDSEQGFTIDGVRWKVRLDYGVGATDYRGGWKNAGA